MPALSDLSALLALAIVVGGFILLGSAAARRPEAEVSLLAGWGVAAAVLTVWGIVTALPLRIPLLGLGGAALLMAPWVPRLITAGPLWRVLLLSAPLWLVLAPAAPSQVDTWLNLLPNAAYLVDHGMLPRHDRPPSWSFLPVAPYNTQLVAFAVSVAAGGLVPNALALFNVGLLVAAAALFARTLASAQADRPPWWTAAAGLALVLPLNPGFVPRTHLSGYGETPIAVCTLAVAWLAAGLTCTRDRSRIAAIALILLALVNTKQSAIGMVAALALAMALTWAADPAIRPRAALVLMACAVAPSLMLWLTWRGYAVTAFAAGELRPLRFADWNLALLPEILGAMVREMVQKATYFACVLAVAGLAAWRWRHAPRDTATRLLTIAALTIGAYTGFILFTYVAHFPADMARNAHSFYRYATHLSLLVMLGLAVALHGPASRLAGRLGRGAASLAGAALIGGVLLFPLALWPMLRFDRQAPLPQLFATGPEIAALIPDGSRVLLVTPGDQFDSAGSLLRGMLLFLEPRRPSLWFETHDRLDPMILEQAFATGFDRVLITCARAAPDPARGAGMVLLGRRPDGWTVLRRWDWPEDLRRSRFGGLVPRAPFCADR